MVYHYCRWTNLPSGRRYDYGTLVVSHIHADRDLSCRPGLVLLGIAAIDRLAVITRG